MSGAQTIFRPRYRRLFHPVGCRKVLRVGDRTAQPGFQADGVLVPWPRVVLLDHVASFSRVGVGVLLRDPFAFVRLLRPFGNRSRHRSGYGGHFLQHFGCRVLLRWLCPIDPASCVVEVLPFVRLGPPLRILVVAFLQTRCENLHCIAIVANLVDSSLGPIWMHMAAAVAEALYRLSETCEDLRCFLGLPSYRVPLVAAFPLIVQAILPFGRGLGSTAVEAPFHFRPRAVESCYLD
mmetsp:Transcript_27699/g.65039  ORF Transcript_27699/g.65039 Transcript_27699/m.65039 type:complete len:236 (-) Transcript_27699:1097-1804(-)